MLRWKPPFWEDYMRGHRPGGASKEEKRRCAPVHFHVDSNVHIHISANMLQSNKEPFTSLEEYLTNLRMIAAEFKRITPHIIFATTSPVKSTHLTETNEMIEKYNAAAVQLMRGLGVKIDDIYSVVLPQLEECVLDAPPSSLVLSTDTCT